MPCYVLYSMREDYKMREKLSVGGYPKSVEEKGLRQCCRK